MWRHPIMPTAMALTLLSVLSATACKTTNTGSSTRSNVSSSNIKNCPNYPRIYKADPTAKSRAEQALTTLAHDSTSTPSLDWNDRTGSLKTLNDGNIEICKDTDDLNQSVKNVLTAQSDIFQLTESDWTFPGESTCSQLGADERKILTLRRKSIGNIPQPQSRETISLVVERKKDKTLVKTVFASYLPSDDSAFRKLLGDCEDSDYKANLTSFLQRTTFPLATFDKCSYVAPAQYLANAKDKVDFNPTSVWDWSDDGSSSTLR